MAAEVSWVPNWSVLRKITPIAHARASGFSKSSVTFKDNGILQVTGIAVATIGAVERVNLGNYSSQPYQDIAMDLKMIAEQIVLEGFFNESSGNLRELTRVLCSNDFSSQFSQQAPSKPSLKGSEILLRGILKASSDIQGHIESIHEKYLSHVSGYCLGRSLFKSTSSHVRLGPEGAKTGDLTTAWLGCDSIMILRPTESGEYLVVGEAYCSYLMDGSAFWAHCPTPSKRCIGTRRA